MRFTIGKKLALGFGILLGLMVISSGLTYLKLRGIRTVELGASEVRVPSLKLSADLQRDLNQTQNRGYQAIIAGKDQARREDARMLFDSAWNEIEKDTAALDALAPKWPLQADRDRWAEVKELISTLRLGQETAMNDAGSGNAEAVIKAGNEFADLDTVGGNYISAPLGETADSFRILLHQNEEELAAANRSAIFMMSIALLAALAVGTSIAVFISRNVSAAITAILGRTEAIAAGDLTGEELEIVGNDEFSDLTVAIGKMQKNLTQMIISIAENAQMVANASEEFSAVSQQITANSEETTAQANIVSGATEQVNRNLQTVATGAEQMSSTIQDIAKNATESAQIGRASCRERV